MFSVLRPLLLLAAAASTDDGTAILHRYEAPIGDLTHFDEQAAASDPTIMRSRAVTIDVERLSSYGRAADNIFRLDPFPDAPLTGVVERVEVLSPERRILYGRLAGEAGSSFTLVIRDGVVLGNIWVPSREAYYQIHYLGEGVHVVRQIDESKFPPCGVDAEHSLGGLRVPPGNHARQQPCAEDGSVIDVMVVYTPAARQAEGGTTAMEALVDLSIAESNTSYANSQINTQLRLVYVGEVDYDESSGMSTALARLRDPADGYLDEVHDLRNEHNADLVALLTEGGGYCGVAYVMQTLSHDFEAAAFSVTARSCAAGNLTFPHELGHNMGCAHDRNNARARGLYSYSYGYQDPDAVFRTVMAYNCPGSCPRVRNFSNPDVTYSGRATGVPVGDPDEAHNALSINQAAETIACFRNADCNNNGIPDYQDIANGTSEDCTGNGVPDECEPDCNQNGDADSCDILNGVSIDCEENAIPDECEPYRDCNGNGQYDSCDIRDGISDDCNGNWIPDECIWDEADCNQNNVPDDCDINSGTSEDCNRNARPDECDILEGISDDCNQNGVPDECDISSGLSDDCNTNGVLDACEITDGTVPDGNHNGVPDMCEAPVLFVHAGATGLNYGTDWANAYTDLQDALNIAANRFNTVTEIWVAAGTYTPSALTEPGDPRSATFQLLEGIALYGGFVGTESNREERDPASNVTIMSGDLNGDDGPNFANYGENAYHVVTGSGVDESAVLDGFTISAGRADGDYPYYHGAGLYNWAGRPSVLNCVFIRNVADGNGGAVFNWADDPTFVNCKFLGNLASVGAGMHNHWYAEPTLVNCVFSGNRASQQGGGVSNHYTCLPTMINCTLSRNSVTGTDSGGGVYAAWESRVTLTNCILWGNTDPSGTSETAQIRLRDFAGDTSSVGVDYSCVQGWSGAFGGSGNTGNYPSFADDDGPDNIVGTEDDDLRLSALSPSVDAGNNNSVPSTVVTDLEGSPRFVDMLSGLPDTGNGVPPIVDMGAYEAHVDCNFNGLDDQQDIAAGTSQDCNEDLIPDECEGDCNGNGLADSCELESGTGADCNGNSYLDECDIADGLFSDANGNGVPDTCEASVLFVRAGATGRNDGTSWADAFTDLQDALDVAENPSNSVTEIWVAAGVYRPSRRRDGQDPRTVTFQLVNGTALYGGFVGNETSRSERRPTLHVTVLSGDVDGDDGPGFPYNYNAENAYHVVTGSNTDETAVLDGFTITAGYANGPYDGPYLNGYNAGGGMFVRSGSPRVMNCTFTRNTTGGFASGGGGFSIFYGNNTTLINCAFKDNLAPFGGGMSVGSGGNPVLINCTFIGNEASSLVGGAIYNSIGGLTLINCVVDGNVASDQGGAIFTQGTLVATNCTFTENEAASVGGVHTYGSAVTTLANSILWANRDNGGTGESAQLNSTANVSVDYSCVMGWTGALGGSGNTGDDPLFEDADGANNIPGTDDDNLRLSADSPSIDAADNTAVPADASDLDQDGDTTEPIPFDLDGAPRLVDHLRVPDTGTGVPPIVDMGAYERPNDDCDGNGIVDMVEIATGAAPDCNENEVIDICDIRNGTSQDCDEGGVPDECQPDCDQDGTPDACELQPIGNGSDCNGNSVPDECDIADGTSAECNTNGVPDECEGDCNGNSVPDDCDITNGTSEDIDGNGVPDECDIKPAALPVGSRYLAVTPVPGPDPVALLITPASRPCLTWYVNGSGRLGFTRFFQLPEQWGTVYVGDRDIVPNALFRVQTDTGDMWSAPVEATTAVWGDVTGGFADGDWTAPDGTVNIVDATAALARFANLPNAPLPAACDLQPETPDGVVDILDVTYILDAFKHFPYPFTFPDPCP